LSNFARKFKFDDKDAGLPDDGAFSDQRYEFGYVSEGFGMQNVDTFYGHLECTESIWYILWQSGTFLVIWYISARFGMFHQEQSGNPQGRMKNTGFCGRQWKTKGTKTSILKVFCL
jgi:hypothetical protein